MGSSSDFQPRFPSKSKPITAMLSTGPGLNLHKAPFSGPAPLSQPTLKIEEAHSLATAKLRTSQSALLIQPDNSRLLLRAEAPTSSPGHFILVFHARDYPKSRPPLNSWLCLCGYVLKELSQEYNNMPPRRKFLCELRV